MVLHEITRNFENDESVTLRIIENERGVHWEVESDVWNEVQPPDPDIAHCVHDLIENMSTYVKLGVTYSDTLLSMAIDLKKSTNES